VPDTTDKVYQPARLDAYSFAQRIAVRAAGAFFYMLIYMIGLTIRFEIEGDDPRLAATSDSKPIFAVWHDRIFLGTYFLRGSGIVFLTSQSFDGEYIARFLQRFGFGVIRGSSTRGGARGLAQMVRGMKRGLAMGFTVDGPKGPRYIAKPGPILLAKKTASPILPFLIEPSKYWTVNSWDRLQIPRPFARAKVLAGKMIEVEPGIPDDEAQRKLSELQQRLDELVERGREWREKI
jgi:hypothetical protein